MRARDIKNELYTSGTITRWMRVVDDDSGEYYDIPVASGSSVEERMTIADNIRFLTTKYITPNSPPFKWTRIVLYHRQCGMVTDYNGEGPVGHTRPDPEDGEIEMHNCNKFLKPTSLICRMGTPTSKLVSRANADLIESNKET